MSIKVSGFKKIGEEAKLSFNEFITNVHDHRKEIAELYRDYIEDYVPYRTGQLANSSEVDDAGNIVYSAISKKGNYNYARIQYENLFFYHDLPESAYWDEAANEEIWSAFIADVNRLLDTKWAKHKPRNKERKVWESE